MNRDRLMWRLFAAVVASAGASASFAAQPAGGIVPSGPVVVVEREEPATLPAEVPAATEAAAPCAACDPADAGFDWAKVPRTRPMPKLGNFPILPTGPGYYSFLDTLRGDYRQAPPKYPYPRFGIIPPSFFDVDNFSYLDNPNNTEHDAFDCLKRIHLGDNWLFVTGGDVRARYENHYNFQLTHNDNDFEVSRARVYTDLWYRDSFRFYAEYLGAWITNNESAHAIIDHDKSDILNLFVDVKLFDGDGSPGYVRIGRQELLLGSQRMVSTLDWANTRRTFQGVRAFRTTEKFDVDLFWVQPVVPSPNRFDSVDNNVNFAGLWGTYRPKKNQSIDMYYMILDNTNGQKTIEIERAPFTRHTFGGRFYGDENGFLYDVEMAMQLGTTNHRNLVAGMATAGLGYNWKDAAWNPTVWAYYDYASGGNPTDGTNHNFHSLFPFGHYYMGWVDVVGRQNIHDFNLHLWTYPTKWITMWTQFHSFWLADKQDALFNAAGVPLRYDPTGAAGSHVGEELDFIINFHLSKHADIMVGYSYLWGGEFLQKTATDTLAADTSFFWTQFSYRW